MGEWRLQEDKPVAIGWPGGGKCHLWTTECQLSATPGKFSPIFIAALYL